MKAFHPLRQGLVLGALLLLTSIQESTSNIQAGNVSVPSLPALFGRSMLTGRIYKARLQFLRENPYLCDEIDPHTTSYVAPTGQQLPTQDGNFTFLDPIALVAARGECPFERKAKIAASVGVGVEFLVVYNFNVDGEDAIVPMYSEYGTSNLVLLSVTHRGGQQLKEYIAHQAETVLQQGGPVVDLDSVPPEGILSIEDLQEMLISALGLFFVLISASSCMMICAGSRGYVITTDGRLVLMREAHQAGTPVTSLSGRPYLLTEEQVQQVSHASSQAQAQAQAAADQNENATTDSTSAAAAAAASASTNSASEDQDSCAVCIDDFAEDADDIITLPCRHKFHTDCIVPWLTERQSKCPLCKFDVMGYCYEMESAAHHAAGGGAPDQQQQQHRGGGVMGGSILRNLSDRILRYRWTLVRGGEEMLPDRDGIALAPNEMDVDSLDGIEHNNSMNELELTDQHLT